MKIIASTEDKPQCCEEPTYFGFTDEAGNAWHKCWNCRHEFQTQEDQALNRAKVIALNGGAANAE